MDEANRPIFAANICTSDSARQIRKVGALCGAVPLVREGDDAAAHVRQGGGVPEEQEGESEVAWKKCVSVGIQIWDAVQKGRDPPVPLHTRLQLAPSTVNSYAKAPPYHHLQRREGTHYPHLQHQYIQPPLSKNSSAVVLVARRLVRSHARNSICAGETLAFREAIAASAVHGVREELTPFDSSRRNERDGLDLCALSRELDNGGVSEPGVAACDKGDSTCAKLLRKLLVDHITWERNLKFEEAKEKRL
ncbi:hypothetical protein B0H14DRAFT_3704365 [Mycena olivaceomarginata]|nr:hypothetical protein B0H14DRAFT_3704365 [Mycena olivaceomarginata]